MGIALKVIYCTIKLYSVLSSGVKIYVYFLNDKLGCLNNDDDAMRNRNVNEKIF